MLFKNGESPYKTPQEFQKRARQDIENHIEKFKYADNQGDSNNNQAPVNVDRNLFRKKRSLGSPLLKKSTQQKNPNYNNLIGSNKNTKTNQYGTQMTYGSSPLRQTLADSNVTTLDRTDECSTIDSGKSGCSLTRESAQHLLQQQQESLNRILTRASTVDNSLFSGEGNSIYTANTFNTNNTLTLPNDKNLLTLNQALPHDFSDYYSPDLDVEKFSNGRPLFTKRPLKNWELNDLRSLLIYPELKPEWNNKVPEVQSPYPNIRFRIQIIPNYYSDNQITEYLAHSDIYKEAKFDMNFKLKTASYIVEKARLRHKHILLDSFNLDPSNFNEFNLTSNIQTDCYFKFEWRNIIENYLLNLGIEYQCRSEFKSRISKLKKITHDKNFRSNSSPHLQNNLCKKVLVENKSSISEEEKMNLWKEVQSDVYKCLNMDGWATNS